jgi:hypothetical protein
MAGKKHVGYVDVDDTLVRSFGSKRIPMTSSVNYIRLLKDSGAVLYCWSSGGAEYARKSAEELGIVECFEGFLAKPDFLIDDISFTKWDVLELHPNEAASTLGEDLLGRIGGAL